MKSIDQIIKAQTVQGTGIDYFVANPMEFAELLRKDLRLAYQYGTHKNGLSSQNVCAMQANAYTTSFVKRPEQFFNSLVDVLFELDSCGPDIQYIESYNALRTIQVIDSLDKNDTLCRLSLETKLYVCIYTPLDIILYWSKNENLTFPLERQEIMQWHLGNVQRAVNHHRKKMRVDMASELIITLLGRLGRNNPLDPEFSTGKLKRLIEGKHYEVCAAILLHTTSQTIADALCAKYDDKDIFQQMISCLPESYSAVAQSIAALKDLNQLDPYRFQSFLAAPRTGDLFVQLANKSPYFANALCTINHNVVKRQFCETAANYPVVIETSAPPPEYPKDTGPTGKVCLTSHKLAGTPREIQPKHVVQQDKGSCTIS